MAGEGAAASAAAAEVAADWRDGWRGGELLGAWEAVRAGAVAPALAALSRVCLAMSAMLLVEAVFLAAASHARRRPERRYRADPLGGGGAHDDGEDEEAGLLGYPMVLVQIPMFNEREVYKLSIGAACGLSWPSDRIIVQVLDDSTDPTVKDLVELECKFWANEGKNVKYEVRNTREGYKAGALKEGMLHAYVQRCDFLAVFDADFQPEPDFLMRTIPYLARNPQISLVQARWEFVNPNECLMTRIQKMTLDYHFKVEQEAGTAGVWRISAIKEAGGWDDRTTVEDMDLAVRAGLKGWKFVYVGDVKVKSELPSNLKAYRRQQHRWTCGAANLFRKMGAEILLTKEVSFWRKLYLLYSFFFVRKVVAHVVPFMLYCVVIPLSVLVPEVTIPVWGMVYIPTAITLLYAIRNPSSIHFIPFWILFENVMSFHRTKAMFIGLLELGSVNEWVVTEKLGSSTNTKPISQILERPRCRFWDRWTMSEILFAAFLFFCATYNLVHGGDFECIYIYLQAITFLIVGTGFCGISNS
ncbi:probable mannan synthase 3 isoform X2 [Brachypodium distachyon]|uniref:probable mannan synthase 3 isoform X2 n=1 Tax=Brachypodium distachyon TaxID=15368 RepID=UPI00053008C0|nr:probable mannan synthase 3 isoform X2 [Brachypodium distachyon]|eukprot:XP_010227823.1 probable mannan synthase 3 isoform X2 [Brachypodium distachyon]